MKKTLGTFAASEAVGVNATWKVMLEEFYATEFGTEAKTAKAAGLVQFAITHAAELGMLQSGAGVPVGRAVGELQQAVSSLPDGAKERLSNLFGGREMRSNGVVDGHRSWNFGLPAQIETLRRDEHLTVPSPLLVMGGFADDSADGD